MEEYGFNNDNINLVEIMSQMTAGLADELGPFRYEEIKDEEGFITLSDGVKLHFHLFLPKEEGSWPVILMRNPYMANNMINNLIYGPTFAKFGYAYLNVSVRGCVDSEGDFEPFVNEAKDGKEVLDWIEKQSWCNGALGTMGESYLGHVQWAVSGLHHPILKTMYIGVYGVRGYHFFYRRGMFRTELNDTWTSQMIGDHLKEFIMPPKLFELQQQAYSVRPQIELGEQLIGKPVPWFKKWATQNFETDDYWQKGFWKDLYNVVDEIDIPIHFQGGWFDIFLRSELESYRRLPKNVREKSRFVIEPYSHSGCVGGCLDYPNADALGKFQIKGALEWFDYQLKGMEYNYDLGVVEGYVIRDGSWKKWKDDLSSETSLSFYLNKQKLDKTLPISESSVSYLYDPSNPVETRGGNLLSNNRDPFGMPENSVEQIKVGERADVLSFVSNPLEEDVTIVGKMEAEIFVSSDVEATAFTVKVMEVFEDGTSVNILDDITDIRCIDETSIEEYIPNQVRKLKFELLDTCWKINAGSKIRLDISSSNFPAYHIHPNVKECFAETTNSKIAHQTIYYGGIFDSKLIIPLG